MTPPLPPSGDSVHTVVIGAGYAGLAAALSLAANPAPGVWFEHGATGWRTPCGRVQWARSETASVWNGYIDGTIASAQRAADEIVAAATA